MYIYSVGSIWMCDVCVCYYIYLCVYWLISDLHTENTKFQKYKIEVQVLNTTEIASGYVGCDPQGGTSDESVL